MEKLFLKYRRLGCSAFEITKKNILLFGLIPRDERTYEICKWVAENHPDFYDYIPKKHRTAEVRKIVFGSNFSLIQYMIERINYIEKYWKEIDFYFDIDKKKAKELLKDDLDNFLRIPPHLIDQEMVTYALSRVGDLFVFLPDRFVTKDNLKIALKDKQAFKKVYVFWHGIEKFKQEVFNDFEIIKELLLRDASLFLFLDKQCYTPELFDFIIDNDLTRWEYDLGWLSDKVADNLIDWKNAIGWIPNEHILNRFFESTKSADYNWISYINNIPENLLTDDVFYKIQKRANHKGLLRMMPKERRTKEVCEFALNINFEGNISYVPDNIFKDNLYTFIFDGLSIQLNKFSKNYFRSSLKHLAEDLNKIVWNEQKYIKLFVDVIRKNEGEKAVLLFEKAVQKELDNIN